MEKNTKHQHVARAPLHKEADAQIAHKIQRMPCHVYTATQCHICSINSLKKQHKTWLQEDMSEAMLRSNITEEHAAKKIISQHPYQRLRSRHRGRAAQLQQVRRGDLLCQFLQQDSPASLLDPRCTNQTRQSRPQMEWRTLIC